MKAVLSLLTAWAALTMPAQGKGAAVYRARQASTVGAQLLEVGQPMRRELAGGEGHVYVVWLAAGRYARVAVRQLGVDAVLALVGVDGKDVLSVDSANGTRGEEALSLKSDEAGEYRLRVTAKDKYAARGEYEISVVEERAATPADAQRVAAETAFAAGEALRRAGTEAKWRDAAAKCEESRQLWRQLGDARGEAYALLCKGKSYYYLLGGLPDSLASYQEALRLLEPSAAPLDVAVTHQVIGITQLAMADGQAARENFQLALQVFRGEGDRKLESNALYQIGRVYYLEGDINQAVSYYNQALPLKHALNDRAGEAYTLLGLGRSYANGFRDYDQAFALYSQALALLNDIQENRLAAQTWGDMGRLYFSKGDYERAFINYNKGVELLMDGDKLVGDKLVYAELLTYVGMVYSAQGHHQKAIENFVAALALQQDGGDRVGEGFTRKNIGVAYSAVGDYAKALESLNLALGIWREVVYRTAEADTRYEIARVESKLGSTASLRDAGEQLDLALPVLEALRTKISNQTLRTSYFASVQKYYELRIDVLMRLYAETKDKKLEAQALGYSERARARSLLDTLIEADANIREGVDRGLLEQEAALQRRLSFLAQRQVLGNTHTQAEAEAATRELNSVLNRYRELEAGIREKSPRYASLIYPLTASVEEIQSHVLEKDQMLLEYALGEERSYVWAVTRRSVESYVLPPRAAVEASADRVMEMLTARNQLHRGETLLGAQARVKRADAEYGQASAELSRVLLGQVKGMEGATRLIVVGDGALQYLPFAALPSPAESKDAAAVTTRPAPLLVGHELETQPSASFLAEMSRLGPGAAGTAPAKLIAVVADPVFSQDDERVYELRAAAGRGRINKSRPQARPTMETVVSAGVRDALKRAGMTDGRGEIARLSLSSREAKEILAGVSPADRMEATGFDANKELVISGKLAQYRIIHFATHGILDKEHPELSGILLSLLDERERPREGFLQMHEVYNLRLPAELVVLSACETGVGKVVRGEGLAALSRGFMYAGAEHVVASLWEVTDSGVTVKLMKSFYDHLLADSDRRPAAALRAAQLELWRENPEKSPYFWAAFVVQGGRRGKGN
jgi:CHAT domain-containing protein/predicted negative regulator of RcsB-dependent stress response